MSLDWPFVAVVACGHAALVVWLINVSHGLGLRDRGMAACAKMLLLSAVWAATALLAWEVLQGPWWTWPRPVAAYAFACTVTASIGLPTLTLTRLLRRIPRGISGQATVLDLAEAHGDEALIGEGRYSWLLRLPGNESLRLRKHEWDVVVPGLPPACDGLSLVHVSDLHLARCFRRRFFEAVAEELAAWDADLVFFTGDLIDDDEALDWVVPVLSRLRGKLGTFGILGNHDFDHHPDRVRGALADAGFTDLEGRWAEIEVADSTWAIGGTSYPWGVPLDLRTPPEADFRLLLSHSPDRFPGAVRSGLDLVLSGHNHGGQVRLPVIGPLLMPSLYSRRFDRGFFRSGRTLMHVSQGVAGKHPVRYGCLPEVSRLVLRAAVPIVEATPLADLISQPGGMGHGDFAGHRDPSQI